MGAKLPPQALAKLLRSRKRLEEELAAMGADQAVVKAVTRKDASNRGGSWKQQVTTTVQTIEQIDQVLATDGIQLPKPHKWWEPERRKGSS